MKILHIDTSINGDHSVSRRISAQAVRNLHARNPGATITYLDLAATPLPHLTLEQFAAVETRAILDQFQAADIIVIGAGMYNLTIPSQLKAWIDRVVIGGETFRYTETGPVGLAGDKHVVIALARGGYYGEGSPAAAFEHAETYLRSILGFIGVHKVDFVNADGTALRDERDASIERAVAQASSLAA